MFRYYNFLKIIFKLNTKAGSELLPTAHMIRVTKQRGRNLEHNLYKASASFKTRIILNMHMSEEFCEINVVCFILQSVAQVKSFISTFCHQNRT